MTAKEKAEQLVNKMSMLENIYQGNELAKQCAIIAVDEIIKALQNELLDLYDTARDCPVNKKHTNYYEQVKTEIEQL